jgi:hypothetical protein
MEKREIQLGDIALVAVSGITLRLPIIKISGGVIYIEDGKGNISAIINNGTQLAVQGLYQSHTISFEPGSEDNFSIFPDDMMYKILFDLTYEQIMNMCETSTSYMKYCNNEEFWRLRAEHKYKGAGRIIPMSLGFKTYREMYQGFFDTPLNKLKAKRAAEYDNISVLQWLADMEPPIHPNKFGANVAAIKGYGDILEWMGKLKPPVHMTTDTLEKVMEHGHFNILNKILTGEILVEILSASNIPTPETIRGENILSPTDPIPHSLRGRRGHLYLYLVKAALNTARPNVLEWLQNNRILNQVMHLLIHDYGIITSIEQAVLGGKFEMILWLARQQPPILPRKDVANKAVMNGRLDTLIFLKQIGVFPDDGYVEIAAAHHYDDIVKWFGERGIKPLYGYKENVDMEALTYLVKLNVRLNKMRANRAQRDGRINILNMLARIGIFPDT